MQNSNAISFRARGFFFALLLLSSINSYAGAMSSEMTGFDVVQCSQKICIRALGPKAYLTPMLNYISAGHVTLEITKKNKMETYNCQSFSYELNSGFIACETATEILQALSVDIPTGNIQKYF